MYLFHWVVFVLIVSTAFVPLDWLRYVYAIPGLIAWSWVVFDGCLLDRRDEHGKRVPDISGSLHKWMGSVKLKTIQASIVAVMVMLPTIMTYRLLKKQ